MEALTRELLNKKGWDAQNSFFVTIEKVKNENYKGV